MDDKSVNPCKAMKIYLLAWCILALVSASTTKNILIKDGVNVTDLFVNSYKRTFFKLANSKVDSSGSVLEAAFKSTQVKLGIEATVFFVDFTLEIVKQIVLQCRDYNKLDSQHDDVLDKARSQLLSHVLIVLRELGNKVVTLPDAYLTIFTEFVYRFTEYGCTLDKSFFHTVHTISLPFRHKFYQKLPQVFVPRIHRFPVFSFIAQGNKDIISTGSLFIRQYYQKTIDDAALIPSGKFNNFMNGTLISILATDFFDHFTDLVIEILPKIRFNAIFSVPPFFNRYESVLSSINPINPDSDLLIQTFIRALLTDHLLEKLDDNDFVTFMKLANIFKSKNEEYFKSIFAALLSESKEKYEDAKRTFHRYQMIFDVIEPLQEMHMNFDTEDSSVLEELCNKIRVFQIGDNAFQTLDSKNFTGIMNSMVLVLRIAFLDDYMKYMNTPDSKLKILRITFFTMVLQTVLDNNNNLSRTEKTDVLVKILSLFNQKFVFPMISETTSTDDAIFQCLRFLADCVNDDNLILNNPKHYPIIYDFLLKSCKTPTFLMNKILLNFLESEMSQMKMDNVHMFIKVSKELGIFSPEFLLKHLLNMIISNEKDTNNPARTKYISDLYTLFHDNHYLDKTSSDILKKLIID